MAASPNPSRRARIPLSAAVVGAPRMAPTASLARVWLRRGERPGASDADGYGVEPVPLSSNGVAASACSELPGSTRSTTGGVVLPAMNTDRPVIEYMPAPGFMPREVALTVIVNVQGVGGRVWKHVPAGVAGVPAVVGLNSSEVKAMFVLSIRPASTRPGPSGGLSR